MLFKKILFFLLVATLLFIYPPASSSSYETPLSPPTVFQEQPQSGEAPTFRNSSSGEDIKFFTVAFAIGEHLLFGKVPLRRLERAVRFGFSDNADFLKGVKLKHVRYKDGVVKIPYRRNRRFFIVRVSAKNGSGSSNSPASDRFNISVSELFVRRAP